MLITSRHRFFLKILFIALFFLTFVYITQTVEAVSIVDTGDGKYATGDYVVNDFVILAIRVSNIILGVIGSLSLAVFVYAGFLLMLSSGSSDKVSQAKKAIIAAVFGIIITLGSYTIIQFTMTTMGVTTPWTGTIQKITN